MLLRHLAALSPDTQQRLLAHDRVRIVEFVEGDFVKSDVQIGEIESRRLEDVFSDHIISVAEQRESISRRGLLQSKPPPRTLTEAQKSGRHSRRHADEPTSRSTFR